MSNVPGRPARRVSRTAVAGLVLTAAAIGACQKAAPRTMPAREFEAQWQRFVAATQFALAESLIDTRERELPGDAEVYVARGNLYMQQALRRGVVAGMGGARDSAGRSTAPGLDPTLADAAVGALREGIGRHPGRLDLRFGLAFVFQNLGRPEDEVALLRETVRFAKEHPGELRWSYGEPLPRPPNDYVPETLHDYAKFYGDRHRPGDDRWTLEIASLTAGAYPRHTLALMDVAYALSLGGDMKQSLEFLKRAEAIDSTNAMVLLNMGAAYHALGQRDMAGRCYRRALLSAQASGFEEVAGEAVTRLELLGAGRAGPTALRSAPASAPPPPPKPRRPTPKPGAAVPRIETAPPPPVDTAKASPPAEQPPETPPAPGSP